jgi:hypothetical protein
MQDGCFMPVAWAAEDAFAKVTGATIVSGWATSSSDQGRFQRLLRRLQSALTVSRFEVAVPSSSQDVMLFLMGLSKAVLPILRDPSYRKWLYLFDTWEPGWQLTEDILRSAESLQCVFMSSSQSVEHFRGRLKCDVQWLPQAAISTEFSPPPIVWSKKRKTILNIGRTNRVLNEFFIQFSQKHGFEYLRDRFPAEARFKTRASFLDALHSAMIVCVHPRDLDHSSETGCVSMLTARNFEAYQSGGVVCGFKPGSGEFDRVFPGLPFIEFHNAGQFESQLLSALTRPEPWISTINTIRQNHTWESRSLKIAEVVRNVVGDPLIEIRSNVFE